MSDPQMPAPDPALRQLDRFVGEWELEGRTAGAAEPNVKGRATYRWLPGGFFLEQRIELDFAGMAQIHSLELVGYDPETGTFPSQVYSNMSPQPLPYTWTVEDGSVTISVSYGPLDATFRGAFGADGDTFGGEWAPNPGADESVNVPYAIEGHRVG
jgi:hypothetical protein